MIRRIRDFGVFTLVTLLVFAATAALNARSLAALFGTYKVETEAGVGNLSSAVPHVFAYLVFLGWVMRVYLQFVGVDASRPMRTRVWPYVDGCNRAVGAGEILLRSVILTGVSIFPGLCGALVSPDTSAKVAALIRAYFFFLSLSLLVWDLGLRGVIVRKVFKRARRSRHSLVCLSLWGWLLPDMLMCACFGFLWVGFHLWKEGQNALMLAMSLFPMMALCLLAQYLAWTARIISAIKA